MPGDEQENGPVAVEPGALTRLLRELATASDARALADTAAPPEPRGGMAIARFELVREIGRGGFGIVFEAHDRELGRAVAFKLVRPGQRVAAEEQLLREADAIAKLSHPNLVALHDVGRCEYGPYLVLELLRGIALHAHLTRAPLPPDEALRIAREIARGLEHAHSRGVVHRDLKPSNVFLCSNGQPKLLDFGMAHAFGRRRVEGGTPAYMAPEQRRGAPEDERADVFALGVILHEMLSGALPGSQREGEGVSRPALALDRRLSDLPGLQELLLRMLAEDPVDRPRDGGEALAELETLGIRCGARPGVPAALAAPSAAAPPPPSAADWSPPFGRARRTARPASRSPGTPPLERRPAKVSPPRSAPASPRPALFARLDATSRAGAFIEGPPGAGKTTLVASWLAARGLGALWYQVDPGDADVADFFYYVGKSTPRRRGVDLPLLAPEYRAALPLFARRWFRLLADAMAEPFVLVLDNLHAVAPDADLVLVLREGLEELPAGRRAILVGRAPPPPALARLIVNGALDHILPSDLILAPDEARAIAALRAPRKAPRERVEAAIARCGGWAAGLVLLLAREVPGAGSGAGGAPQELFDYLGGEILDRTDADTRRVLLEFALLPSASERVATEVTGSARTGELLADLARRGWFTYRRGNAYELHPLFREFLLARARAELTRDRADEVRRRAAALLEAQGEVDAAVELLVEAADVAAVMRVGVAHAPHLLAAGRSETLLRWLGALPEAACDANPWVWYWLGLARLGTSAAAARRNLERALAGFERVGDAAGWDLAWAAAVDTFIWEWSDFTPLDAWLEVFDAHHRDTAAPACAETETSVVLSMFAVLVFHCPDHPALPAWEERVVSLALGDGPSWLRLRLATYLLVYAAWWKGDVALARRVVDALAPLASTPSIDPLTAIMWRLGEAPYHWNTGGYDACARLASEAAALADAHGVHVWDFITHLQAFWGALAANDVGAASAALDRVNASLRPEARLNVGTAAFARGILALRQGDAGGALAGARVMIDLASRGGMPFGVLIGELLAARAHALAGDAAAAERELAAASSITAATRSRFGAHVAKLVEALLALDRSDEASAVEALRAALSSGRDAAFADSWLSPAEIGRLAAVAIASGVEVEEACRLVRRRRAPAPERARDLAAWPWPVEIRTLGTLAIVRDGALVAVGRRDGRALDVLAAIVALGGAEVPRAAIEQRLWPDARGDAARQALDNALRRLRKLLGVKGALQVRDGMLSLNGDSCFVDALALERVTEEALSLVKRRESIGALRGRIVALDRGPFLPATREPWATALRDRLSARLARLRSAR